MLKVISKNDTNAVAQRGIVILGPQPNLKSGITSMINLKCILNPTYRNVGFLIYTNPQRKLNN